MTAAFTDVEQVLRLWINAQQASLVGKTHPIEAGAWLNPPRSPDVTHVLLSRLGGGDDPGGLQLDHARISGSVYGATREAAVKAAVAYANALRGLEGTKVVVATAQGNVTMLVADDITGPLYSPDNGVPRYVVDATILLTPGP